MAAVNRVCCARSPGRPFASLQSKPGGRIPAIGQGEPPKGITQKRGVFLCGSRFFIIRLIFTILKIAILGVIIKNMKQTDISTNELTPFLSPLTVMAFAIGTSVGWGSLVVTSNTYLKQAGPWDTVIGLLVHFETVRPKIEEYYSAQEN